MRAANQIADENLSVFWFCVSPRGFKGPVNHLADELLSDHTRSAWVVHVGSEDHFTNSATDSARLTGQLSQTAQLSQAKVMADA